MSKKSRSVAAKTSTSFVAALGVTAVFLLLFTTVITKNAQQVQDTRSSAANSTTGNGAPSGPHYNLNIIGKGDKTCGTNTGGGNRIFVPLSGSSKIMLSQGSFDVLDYCGLDGSASFQLPNPDPTNSGTTTYSVYARALGKPKGSSTTTTCATDPTTSETYCSVYSYVATRNTGKSTFTNVSKELLYVYVDLNADGALERYPLFSEALKDYYWQYDNNGLKVLQLRFYEVPTTVPAP